MDVAATGPPSGTAAGQLAAAFSTVRTEVLAATAGKLGISVDRLRAELAAGRPLADIAAVIGASVAADAPAPVPRAAPRSDDATVDLLL